MRLTAYTDYALRLLMYLAVADGPATIGEIAERFRVSRNHLMKIAFELGVAGYLETSRGRHGGLRLARAPAAIGLGEVIRATEGTPRLVPCAAEHDRSCPLWQACVLRRVMEQAEAAFVGVLDGFTLADLAGPRGTLRSLLQIGESPAPPA